MIPEDRMSRKSIGLMIFGGLIGALTCCLIQEKERTARKTASNLERPKEGQSHQSDRDDFDFARFDEVIHKVKLEAIKGSVDSAISLFEFYTYSGDYQRAFFWASLCDDLGGHPEAKELKVIAKENLHSHTREVGSLEVEAQGGSLKAARELFIRLTYHDRDYEKSLYWATLIRDSGDRSDLGNIEEMARRNAESEILSKFK